MAVQGDIIIGSWFLLDLQFVLFSYIFIKFKISYKLNFLNYFRFFLKITQGYSLTIEICK
jgi:hypothetical protein